jgi:hypothetical protein
LLPALFILAGAWMTFYGMLLEPKVSFAAIATIAAGAAVYHFRLIAARRARSVAQSEL